MQHQARAGHRREAGRGEGARRGPVRREQTLGAYLAARSRATGDVGRDDDGPTRETGSGSGDGAQGVR